MARTGDHMTDVKQETETKPNCDSLLPMHKRDSCM